MTTRDLDHFMANPDEFAGLTEDQRATLYLSGSLEGDTPDPDKATAAEDPANAAKTEGTGESSASPDAASTAAAAAASTETDPVVLAKDGKHTIPYEELQAARERATQLERENAELLAKIKPAETPAAAANPETDPAAAAEKIDLDQLEDQYQDALLEGDKPKATEIRRQINTEIKRQSEESAVQRYRSEREAEQADATAKTAQEQFAEVAKRAIETYPFLDVKATEANQQAITDVKVWRDHLIGEGKSPAEALAAAVERFGPMYAGTQSKPQPSSNSNDQSVAAKAAQAIAAAKSGVPASLSDIPAGAPNPHDEAGALLNMGGNALLTKFAGKTPEQIEALMAKVI